MELELLALAGELGFELEVLDVDADPGLEVLYNEMVPVLLHEGTELCHYFLDSTTAIAYANVVNR